MPEASVRAHELESKPSDGNAEAEGGQSTLEEMLAASGHRARKVRRIV